MYEEENEYYDAKKILESAWMIEIGWETYRYAEGVWYCDDTRNRCDDEDMIELMLEKGYTVIG